LIEMNGGFIDDYENVIIPYVLTINKKRVIGHKRALKQIKSILEEEKQ